MEQASNYRAYVEEGLGAGLGFTLTEVAAGTMLGNDAFVERITRGQLAETETDVREQPGLRHMQGTFDTAEGIAAVAGVYHVDERRLVGRRGTHRQARRLAVYCVEWFCRSRHSQRELAALFSIRLGGFGSARAKVEEELAHSTSLRASLAAVRDTLSRNRRITEV